MTIAAVGSRSTIHVPRGDDVEPTLDTTERPASPAADESPRPFRRGRKM
jgi:hypothetical protein